MQYKYIAVVSLAMVLLSTGCMRTPEDDVASADAAGTAKPPAGITANLKKTELKPLYNLEYIGSVVDPASKQPVMVDADRALSVRGWAVDPQAQGLAAGVEIAIDGTPYRAAYELPRGDVAEHFKTPGYAKAGFEFQAPAAGFGDGQHQLTIRILRPDNSEYYEGLPVRFVIR